MWDPLAINCASARLEAHPEISLEACPEDPNKDGADDVCLFKGISKSEADAAIAKQGLKAGAQPVLGGGGPPQPDNTLALPDQSPLPGGVPAGMGPDGLPGDIPDGTPMSTNTQGGDGRTGRLPGNATGRADPAATTAGVSGSDPAGRASAGGPGRSTSACEFDLAYLAPQYPVVESSGASLAAGDQVRITCHYAVMTQRVTPASCDEQGQRTAQSLGTPGAATARVLSAIVAVDGQFVSVGNIPAGSASYEKTAIWSFRDAGSHTVSCQVDNPLGSQVRGADPWVAEAISVEVAAGGGCRAPAAFDPAQVRSLPARQIAPPAVLLPGMRSTVPATPSLRGATTTSQGTRSAGQFSPREAVPEDEMSGFPVAPRP
jgi:hypothetical protein